MTTLISIKGKDFVVIGADTQVTEGNLKVPFPYQKIEIVGDCSLIGGCGSVGNLQQVLQIAKRQIRISKVYNDAENISPYYEELVKTLAELNFQMPLEHKHYNSYAFLVAGLDKDSNPCVSSVGSCGAILDIPTFYSDGSGSPYSFSILNEEYTKDITASEALKLGAKALKSSTSLDCYTSDVFQLFLLETNKEKVWNIVEYTSLEEIEKKDKPAKAEDPKE